MQRIRRHTRIPFAFQSYAPEDTEKESQALSVLPPSCVVMLGWLDYTEVDAHAGAYHPGPTEQCGRTAELWIWLDTVRRKIHPLSWLHALRSCGCGPNRGRASDRGGE